MEKSLFFLGIAAIFAGCQTFNSPVAFENPDFVKVMRSGYDLSYRLDNNSLPVGWGIIRIHSLDRAWFCWYDSYLDQLNFIFSGKVDRDFENTILRTVELIEGEPQIKIVQSADGFKVRGEEWVPIGAYVTHFYFKKRSTNIEKIIDIINEEGVEISIIELY